MQLLQHTHKVLVRVFLWGAQTGCRQTLTTNGHASTMTKQNSKKSGWRQTLKDKLACQHNMIEQHIKKMEHRKESDTQLRGEVPLAPSRSLSLALARSLSHTMKLSTSHSLALALSRLLALVCSLSLSLSHTRTHTKQLSLTNNYTHTFTNTYARLHGEAISSIVREHIRW